VDRPSSRPDFVILVYPVISMKEGVTHAGSRNNLLGPEPDPTLIAHLSNETQVTPQTPPTLLIHSVDDLAVPIENSRLMLAALQTAQVPCELHEYPTGGHGFGYDPTDAKSTAPPQWLDRTYDWLTCHGFTTAGDHD
jgi:acetyl esterase/lipase